MGHSYTLNHLSINLSPCNKTRNSNVEDLQPCLSLYDFETIQNKQIKLKPSPEIVEIGASCLLEKLKAILGLKPHKPDL